MTPREYEEQLRREGFTRIFVWRDSPGAYYPNHTHGTLSAHVILEGEMTLTMNGESRTYRAGERRDVPAGTVHSAKMGPQGCRYIVGEK
jgi:quercetin dioxygenase-like cupin family protein